jgi:hypothetical protein
LSFEFEFLFAIRLSLPCSIDESFNSCALNFFPSRVRRGHGEDVALVVLPKRMIATTRQYMDEDGYMVTEKVMVEAPEDGDADTASSSSSAASASSSSSSSPSSTAAAAPKKSPPPPKAAAPAAAAAKPAKAQSGIMNFFGKK